MKDFAEQFMTTIKKDHITPVPRWVFVLRNGLVWLLGALMIALSATAIATILYLVRTNDWDIYKELASSLTSFVVTTIPYAWFVILGILMLSAYLLFIRTPHGYRYRLVAVTASGIVVSSLLGSIMYAAGVGERVDEYVRKKAPTYHAILSPHSRVWQEPKLGRIAGDVVELNEKNLKIKDEQGTIWTVENSAETTTTLDLTSEKDMPRRVRVFGTLSNSTTFKARKILAETAQKHTKASSKIKFKKNSELEQSTPKNEQSEDVLKKDGDNKKIPATTIKEMTTSSPDATSSSSPKERNENFPWRKKIKEILDKK